MHCKFIFYIHINISKSELLHIELSIHLQFFNRYLLLFSFWQGTLKSNFSRCWIWTSNLGTYSQHSYTLSDLQVPELYQCYTMFLSLLFPANERWTVLCQSKIHWDCGCSLIVNDEKRTKCKSWKIRFTKILKVFYVYKFYDTLTWKKGDRIQKNNWWRNRNIIL